MSARRLAIATGLTVAATYVASALLSGHLSPIARRPLLDGLAPPAPYRWVEPPPELAASNVVPEPQEFRVAVGRAGSDTAVLTTSDAQVTVVLAEGAFEAAAGQRAVTVRIEPLAPSAVEAPDPPRRIAGNVYRVQAAYRPSGDPAPLTIGAQVILTYPQLANVHGGHEVVVSSDGASWTALETSDFPNIVQVDATTDVLAYVAVTAPPATSPSPTRGGVVPVATIAIAASIAVLVIALVVVLRPGASGRRPPTRPR